MKSSNGAATAVRPSGRTIQTSGVVTARDEPRQPGRLDYHRERLNGFVNQLDMTNDNAMSICGRLGIGVDNSPASEKGPEAPGILNDIDALLSRLGDLIDRNDQIVRALQHLA